MSLKITSRGKAVIGAALVASLLTAYAAAANVERVESTTHSTTTHTTTHSTTTPDWTIAPCTVDFRPRMTETITLPAFTYTDRCVQPDGTVTVADTFKVVEVFPN